MEFLQEKEVFREFIFRINTLGSWTPVRSPPGSTPTGAPLPGPVGLAAHRAGHARWGTALAVAAGLVSFGKRHRERRNTMWMCFMTYTKLSQRKV